MYISEEKRELLNDHIDDLVEELRGLQLDDSNDDIEGNIEYVIFNLLSRLYTKDQVAARTALGLLSNVSSEFFRRIVAPMYVQLAYDIGDPLDSKSVVEQAAEYERAGGTD